MQNIYEDGTYLKHNPTWHEEHSAWKAKKIIQIIKSNNLMLSSICEIGCGAGEILNQLSNLLDEDIRFVGYEISPQAFEMCQKKSKENLKFFLKDFLTDDNEYFDLVMAIDVVEHVEDFFELLRQLKNKGTYKIFHIPLDLSCQHVLRSSSIIQRRQSLGHIHYFIKETALATLEDTGYEVLNYFYTAWSLDLPSYDWKTTLLKIPRKLFFQCNRDLAVRVLGGYSLLILAK